MKICVTGSCGFLGSYLMGRLRQQGHDVIGVDDGRSAVVPHGATGIRCTVAGHFRGLSTTYDQVFHLASPVGPVGLLPYAGSIARSIINDTALVAAYCVDHRARLMFVSSSEVYGGTGQCNEEDACRIAQHVPSARLEYAVGKLAAEIMLHNMPGLDYCIVRPFNIVGPRQSARGGFVLPRFVEQAKSGYPLTVYGDGWAVRAFTHAQDIVDGMLLVMKEGKRGLPYNLGNLANRIRIIDLAKLIVNLAGSASSIEHVDPYVLWGSAFAEAGDKWPGSMRATALGWTPVYDLEHIVRECVREHEGSACP